MWWLDLKCFGCLNRGQYWHVHQVAGSALAQWFYSQVIDCHCILSHVFWFARAAAMLLSWFPSLMTCKRVRGMFMNMRERRTRCVGWVRVRVQQGKAKLQYECSMKSSRMKQIIPGNWTEPKIARSGLPHSVSHGCFHCGSWHEDGLLDPRAHWAVSCFPSMEAARCQQRQSHFRYGVILFS